MLFSRACRALSMPRENRLRIAFSFSLRPAVRHKIYVSSPWGIATCLTSTSGRTWVQSSFSNSASNRFIWWRRAYQILPTPFAYRRQIFLTHDPSVHHPDAPRLTVLTFHHAQYAFHGRHVGTIAIEGLITEWKSLPVHDQCDHHLFAVRPMIA